MNVDDIVKLMLAIAVSVSLIGVAFQIMRLIGSLADTIHDLRHGVRNLGEVSDLILADYKEIRQYVRSILGMLKDFNANVVQPVTWLTKQTGKLFGRGRNRKSEQTPPSNELQPSSEANLEQELQDTPGTLE